MPPLLSFRRKSIDSVDTESDCQRSRRQQVEQLFLKQQQKLIRHIMSKGLDKREAEDVAQEAFVKLLGLEQDKISNYIAAYLYKIATNLAIDKLRRKARSPFDEFISDTDNSTQPVSSINPEKTHHNNELLKEMEKSLISLPDKCRLAFLLYKIRGQSYEEIALTLQISPSMVRKYVLRAVRHCYQQLQHEL
tara:strand:+ start:1824 stop:2399 length:576 start_codon:yes stop_codon:yes gene_type:complete